MRARSDHQVFSEPFSLAYYFGPEKRSERFPVRFPNKTFETVLAEVLEAAQTFPVFIKDMAYQLGPLLNPETLDKFTNTFLIRDPAYALPSFANEWSDFTQEEAGYAAQHKAWRIVQELGGDAVMVDSAALCTNPEAVIRQWSERVGIEFVPQSLNWEPGMPEDWKIWESWMESAAQSTGFRPPTGAEPPKVNRELAKEIELARPLYEEMAECRIGNNKLDT